MKTLLPVLPLLFVASCGSLKDTEEVTEKTASDLAEASVEEAITEPIIPELDTQAPKPKGPNPLDFRIADSTKTLMTEDREKTVVGPASIADLPAPETDGVINVAPPTAVPNVN